MKAGKEGPMKKNFPGAFKLKDGDEVVKVTKDVKNPPKNPNIKDFRITMDVPRKENGGEKKKDKPSRPELRGTFK